MIRLALGVAYVGTNFHGWQKQRVGVRTVQVCVEQALSRIANHPVKVYCCGRTDSGVHAKEQIIHFDTEQSRPDKAWLVGANCYLPNDVSFKWVQAVNQKFHARFSAVARVYEYHIYNHPVRCALRQTHSLWEPRILAVDAMRQSAKCLLGRHDFSAFRGSQCQAKTPIKTLEYLTIEQTDNDIVINIKANAFLHHMVRNIVGTLFQVGLGRQPVSWVKTVLHSKDRTQAGMTIPPQGLHFIKAYYSEVLGVNTK